MKEEELGMGDIAVEIMQENGQWKVAPDGAILPDIIQAAIKKENVPEEVNVEFIINASTSDGEFVHKMEESYLRIHLDDGKTDDRILPMEVVEILGDIFAEKFIDVEWTPPPDPCYGCTTQRSFKNCKACHEGLL